MRTKKKWIFFSLIMVSVLVLAAFFSQPAYGQKTVEWRMISSWGPENPNTRLFLTPFVEKINQRAKGRLKISWVGPEAVPPFEQLKPVREGLFNLSFTHSAYHFGEVSLATGLEFYPATAKEMRSAGLFEIVDEAYREKANVTYLAGGVDGVGYHLMLNKKIKKADLTGLKIRTSPFYDPLITALGGAPVRVAPGEIYTALEKGVVEGACWPLFGVLDYKWYEVVKYMVRPLFGVSIVSVLVNLDNWNQLPKDLQELLTKISIEMEEEYYVNMGDLCERDEKELLKRGMELIVLPPKEAEKYLNLFSERSWEELILKRNPEFGPRLKEAVDRMRKQ